MTWKHVVFVVTICALFGMLLGGLFGWAFAMIARGAAYNLLHPWTDVEPVSATAMIAATGGVFLGGGLGCFGILVETVTRWRQVADSERRKPVSTTDLD